MSDRSVVLEYAPLRPRHGWPVFTHAPRLLAALGIIVAVISAFAPLSVGSRRFIVGLGRVTGCVVAVSCLLSYALLRLWRDREEGPVRNPVLASCLLLAVAAFADSHFSVFGDNHLPRLSLRHDYWRSLLACAAVIAFACAFCAGHRLARRVAPPADSDSVGRSSQPETGMGYQIASVFLRDGRRVDHVTIGGIVTEVAGGKEIPFNEDEIVGITATHGR